MNQKMLDRLQQDIDWMTEKYGDDLVLNYGFGHSVYDDYNTGDGSIKWCIRYAQEALDHPDDPKTWPAFRRYFSEEDYLSIIKDTIMLLEKLMEEIPEEDRYVWEEGDF